MASIESLYKNHKGNVYRYCYSLLKEKMEAEDMTIKTFETAMKKIDQTKGYNNHVPWLLTIARHHIYNFWRKNKTISESDHFGKDIINGLDTLIPKDDPSPLESLIQDELLEQTKAALESIPQLQRETIILKHWEGLKFQEISEMTNTPLRTVKYRYYEGLKKIKALLEKEKSDSKLWALHFLSLNHIDKCLGYEIPPSLDTSILPIIKGGSMNHIYVSLQGYLANKAAIVATTGLLATSTLAGGYWLTQDDSSSSPALSSTLSQAVISQAISSQVVTDENQTISWIEEQVTLQEQNLQVQQKQLQVTLSMPDDSSLTTQWSGFEIVNSHFQLESFIVYDYENYQSIARPVVEVGTNSDFGTIFRYPVDSGSEKWLYTNYVRLEENCLLIDGQVFAPCGLSILTARSSISYALQISCTASSQNLSLCDQAVLSLSGQVVDITTLETPSPSEPAVIQNVSSSLYYYFLDYDSMTESRWEEGEIVIPHTSDLTAQIEFSGYLKDLDVDDPYHYGSAIFELDGGLIKIVYNYPGAAPHEPRKVYTISPQETKINHEIVRYEMDEGIEKTYGYAKYYENEAYCYSHEVDENNRAITVAVDTPCYQKVLQLPQIAYYVMMEVVIRRDTSSQREQEILEIADQMAREIYYVQKGERYFFNR